jgi:PAS domain S-box-containing protein
VKSNPSVRRPSDWLGVPLKTGDRTIGVLTAQSYDEGVRYTERDRDILQFVSTQVAMAIERKRGEEALRASEGELRAVFSAMRDVILVLDATGRYRKVRSHQSGSALSLGRCAYSGAPFTMCFPPRQADEFLRHITRALHTGEVVHADYALTIEDRRVWFTATVSPMTYDSVVWVARDITEQKLALEALAESESRYRALYNRSPVMAHSIDLEGRIVAVSDFWLATLGYQRDEVLGRPVTDFLTPESARLARETVLQALMRDGSCTDVEHQMVTSSGQVLDVLLSAISEKDGDGKATQSLAILTDVTERKRIARELQHSQERVEQFVQTTNDVLWDWELETQEIWWAPTLRNLVGFQPHEFQGDSWTRALHPEDRERVWAGLREAISARAASGRRNTGCVSETASTATCSIVPPSSAMRTVGRCAWSER